MIERRIQDECPALAELLDDAESATCGLAYVSPQTVRQIWEYVQGLLDELFDRYCAEDEGR